MRRIICACLVFCLCIPFFADEAKGGFIYGNNWSYMISAPAGYTWDSTSLQQNGIWGLFWETKLGKYIPQKHNMFINPVMKGNGYPSDLESLIKWDIDYYKENTPGLIVEYYKDIVLGDKQKAKAYIYNDKNRNYYSISAYVCEKNASFVFVLVDRSIEDRKKHEKAFEELLSSFIYMNKE